MESTTLTYAAQILAERQQREERLRANERGWLTLAGLFWLVEGENHFGSDPANEIVLPAGKAPARAGIFHFHNGQTRLEAADGVTITLEGSPVRSLEMKSDRQENPDFICLGDLGMLVIQRGDHHFIRLYDKNNPGRTNFDGLKHYPVNEAYRVTANFLPYEPPKPITILDVVGDVYEETSPGCVVFELDGQECRLDAEGDDEGLFFNFRDLTNGQGSYPGGRFLDADAPADGKVLLDFNRAYSPPCAYTDYATCPTPLPQNKLPVRVQAGEMYVKH